MTATTARADTAPSIPTVLGRAVAAEWIRLRTLRSTWWSLLAAAAVMLLIGVALAEDIAEDSEPLWVAAEFAIMPGQFIFLLVVVLAVTSDYSTGAILSSLQWVPHRNVLLLARTAVPVATVTFAAVATSATTSLVVWALVGDAQVVATDVARSLGSIALLVAVGGLLSAGIATVLRNTAGAVTTAFLLLLVLPMMLSLVGVPWLTIVAERLPGYATLSLLAWPQMALELERVTGPQIASTLVSWLVVITAAGASSLNRRDAQ